MAIELLTLNLAFRGLSDEDEEEITLDQPDTLDDDDDEDEEDKDKEDGPDMGAEEETE